MELSLQEQFIQRLETKYGKRDELTSNFGTTPFGQLAKDLCISNSQFTKLITGSATEGMYLRSIDNVNRLIEADQLQEELSRLRQQLYPAGKNGRVQKARSLSFKANRTLYFLLPLFTIAFIVLLYFLYYGWFVPSYSFANRKGHPLSDYFDFDFNSDIAFSSPYLKASEVQDYCPGSAYEGIWSLEEPYKVPLPSSKPGVYYAGISADVRMKVSKTDTSYKKGHILEAYEYLINEIWVDTKQTPLSPIYFDNVTKTYTDAFKSLNFEEEPQFQKVATIHSFFISKITIKNDSIFRKGEPCGRFATDVNQELADAFEVDPQYILENVVSDLTTTECASFANPYCNPNDLEEGKSTISFDCLYTIRSENLGLGGGYPYQKGFRLEKQIYSNNLTCSCVEE